METGIKTGIHLVKPHAEQRSPRAWELSIRLSCRRIQRLNKRRKAGGYLAPAELLEALAERGVVAAVHGDELLVRLDESGELVTVASALVTNCSLAARKAWKTMPHRRVGRPQGARHCDLVSVTLRIDRELWERFRQDESAGLIEDRTATINMWFRDMVDKLKRTKTQARIDAAKNY